MNTFHKLLPLHLAFLSGFLNIAIYDPGYSNMVQSVSCCQAANLNIQPKTVRIDWLKSRYFVTYQVLLVSSIVGFMPCDHQIGRACSLSLSKLLHMVVGKTDGQ